MVHVKVDPKYFRPTEVVSQVSPTICVYMYNARVFMHPVLTPLVCLPLPLCSGNLEMLAILAYIKSIIHICTFDPRNLLVIFLSNCTILWTTPTKGGFRMKMVYYSGAIYIVAYNL